jgi:hypothetical protein
LRLCLFSTLILLFATLAKSEDLTLKIPPITTSVTFGNQPIAITAWGVISRISKSPDQQVFRLKVTADLSDLQRNITGLLQAELNRSDRCGERIAIGHATLAPLDPASQLTVQLHYERYACAKAFGKQMVTRLVVGNGMVPIKLTPAVEQNVPRLNAEVGTIEADGSLGELLRSGSLGTMLQEKIRNSLVSALQKGMNFGNTLPGVVQNTASISNAQFMDAGAGRLGFVFTGEVRVTDAQVELLTSRLKERVRAQ